MPEVSNNNTQNKRRRSNSKYKKKKTQSYSKGLKSRSKQNKNAKNNIKKPDFELPKQNFNKTIIESEKEVKQKERDEKRQLSITQLRNWYQQNSKEIERFKNAEAFKQLNIPSKERTSSATTFSKSKLRTYLKNPIRNYKNLRNLSRYLRYRSQAYRRLITYNASMINLNYRSVIPLVDINKMDRSTNKKKTIKSYYNTLECLEVMNLPLEFYKVYITCWTEDVFFGCAYFDKANNEFFILPLDPDYCKTIGIYPTGDLAFDMDMSYFDSRQDILELWGEPFQSMYKEYQKDTVNNKWVQMPDQYCVCLKQNIDDWETPIPPYIALFNSLINLEDLVDITAIADEQQIYKMIVAQMDTITGSAERDDFTVDPYTAIEYFNRLKDQLPDYTEAVLSPLKLDTISFDNDQTTDVNKVENATKAVFNTSGGAQVLNSSTISGTTAWNGAIRSDEEFALSSLLPQTESWINRFLACYISNPAKVKFLETTRYTVNDFKSSLLKDATYGLPNKLIINSLNGLSELETISLNYLEEDCLGLSSKFVPLQSSNTMNTGNLSNDPDSNKKTDPTASDGSEGAPSKDDTALTDEGEASRDKRDQS